MKHTVSDVRLFMDYLDKKTGYNTKGIKIEVNPRLKTTIAQCLFSYDNSKSLVPFKLEVSKGLLEGNLSPKIFKEIIKHEYAHIFSNDGLKEEQGHEGLSFLMVCYWFKCYSDEVIPYKKVATEIERINRGA